MRNKVIVSLAVVGFFSATGYALADHEAGLPFPWSLGENATMPGHPIQKAKPQKPEARNEARWYDSGDHGYTPPLDYSSARR